MFRNQKSLAKVLRRRLPARVFKIITKIGTLAEDNGFSAYIVGGFVRDMFLGRENFDLDLVVEGDAISFAKILRRKLNLTIVTHTRFRTASIDWPKKFKIDIATARREYYRYPAALPVVRASRIDKDLYRRDFSINTLAINIAPAGFGKLLDPFSGLKDLKSGKIRVLHDKSFIDDPTRIFRAIRFEQRFNFAIERHTRELMRKAINQGMLKRLSKARVGNEVILVLKEEAPHKGLLRIDQLCGLAIVHPGIRLTREMLRQLQSARKLITAFKKKKIARTLDAWLVYFMILTLDLNLKQVQDLSRTFSLSKRDIKRMGILKIKAKPMLRILERKSAISKVEIFEMLRNFPIEGLILLIVLAKNIKAKNRIKLFLYRLSLVKIKLRGKQLLDLRLKPGPEYKFILEKILLAKVNGKLKTKSDELNYLKQILQKV